MRSAERKRGQYGMILALGMVPLVVLAAGAVDMGMMSVHSSEAESVAYAAAHTAIVAYAEGKSVGEAELMAKNVVANHLSSFDNKPFNLDGISWGRVDRTNGAFLASPFIEAAEAKVSRTGKNASNTFFASFLGQNSLEVHGQAMSDQIPSIVDDAICTTDINFERKTAEAVVGLAHDLHKVVTLEMKDPPPTGYYRLYKAGIAESGSSQKNESAVFRVRNDSNPTGVPLPSEANCGDQYVMRDYDNGVKGHFKLKERVYLGTFYIDQNSTNTLEMQHYCAYVNQCPEFHDLSQPCGTKAHSIHLKEGWALCGDPL
ncbi:MAG: Tad domain-containing protein [Myxococcota bacterium]